MTFRPDLSEQALGRLGDFPLNALSAFAAAMAEVCENPYDPFTTSSTSWHLGDSARGPTTRLTLLSTVYGALLIGLVTGSPNDPRYGDHSVSA